MITKKISSALLIAILLFGCSHKTDNAAVSAPTEPMTLSQLAELNNGLIVESETSYATATGKISFSKAYRCQLLTAGHQEYRNAVVLEAEANSLEEAQETLKNTTRGRLINPYNSVYQIPVGYTLSRDPVNGQIYVIYPTKADVFSSDFQYFMIGDFAVGSAGAAMPLIFDTGALLEEADITPFRPQTIPSDVTIEELNNLLVEKLSNPDFDARVDVEDQKIRVSATAPYRGGRTSSINDGRELYTAARRVLNQFGLYMDSFSLTLLDESSQPVYLLENAEYWKNPDAFYLQNCADSKDAQMVDLSSETSASGTATISLSEYDKIQTGDSYSQVVKIIGGPGDCLSSLDAGGFKTSMYAWYGADGFSTATVLFQNDKVITKSQFGLS